MYDISVSKNGTSKAYRTHTILGNPLVEMGLGLYDFVVGLPPTQRKNNAISVIVDRLTKTTHFIAMRNTETIDRLARACLEEIVRLHGVLSSIMLVLQISTLGERGEITM